MIHSLIKEDSLVALKLIDQVITHSSDYSTKNARETKKEKRKAEGDAYQRLDGVCCDILYDTKCRSWGGIIM